ncbi:MAG: carboxylating nicotinate-nucleotide diphosphorylase [Puniceicoccales bacterium]|jgi:nicotinate-nucleotide pyrophosphorylase (carboxylating)|nr:carboxylating nicotinate-nucleotide diphosphorylase [Puniceicoccales bacterium]
MKPETHKTHLFRRLRWDDLCKRHIRSLIRTAIDEDTAGLGLKPSLRTPRRDPSTALIADIATTATAKIVARRECVVCGAELIGAVLAEYAATQIANTTAASTNTAAPIASAQIHVPDGRRVRRNEVIATVSGTAALLLTAERVMLNFLQRLSGIATLAAAYAAKLEGTACRLLDTRKTTPGWRMLEKYAVATGGGWNHRLGLFDRVMLKDNHLAAGDAASGANLAALVRRARAEFPDLAIECEVDTRAQIAPVLEAGADVILLDNFSLTDLRPALAEIADRAWTEVSGGVTLETLAAIAALGPDFVSTGALTHQAAWVDIGLDWQ